MKSREITQSDKELSLRLWSTIGVLVTVTATIFAFFGFSRLSGDAEHQKEKAESLAYQILEIRRQVQSSSRGPASEASFQGEGRVGAGPDGKPYSYQVFEEGANWVVKVWSETQPGAPTEVRIRKDQL